MPQQGDNFFEHDSLLSLQPGMRIDFNFSFICTESIYWLEKKRAVRWISYRKIETDFLHLGEGFGARMQCSRSIEECEEDNQDQGDQLDHLHGIAASALLRMVSYRIGIHGELSPDRTNQRKCHAYDHPRISRAPVSICK